MTTKLERRTRHEAVFPLFPGQFVVYKDNDLNYPIVEDRVWERNDFHYDNVAKAMLTLFVVSTFEGWPG